MSQQNARGILGVLIDLLNWLRIYRQRAFWIQIAAVIIGILLWILVFPEEAAAIPTVAFISFIMTNIIWAASKKPYSCIVGSSVGYGIYNLAVGAIIYHLSILDALSQVFLGIVVGFVFSWFSFFIFNVVGLIKFERKKKGKGIPASNVESKQ